LSDQDRRRNRHGAPSTAVPSPARSHTSPHASSCRPTENLPCAPRPAYSGRGRLKQMSLRPEAQQGPHQTAWGRRHKQLGRVEKVIAGPPRMCLFRGAARPDSSFREPSAVHFQRHHLYPERSTARGTNPPKLPTPTAGGSAWRSLRCRTQRHLHSSATDCNAVPKWRPR